MQDELFDRFKTRIEDLGLTINKVDEDGLIHIDIGENTLRISLDNVRKSFEQDGWIFHSIVCHRFQWIVYQCFSPKFTSCKVTG